MVQGPIDNAPDYVGLLERLLDSRYPQLAEPVVRAIADDLAERGVLRIQLDALEAEARRLEAEGLKLDAANPVYRATVEMVRRQTVGYGALMTSRSGVLTQAGADAADMWVQMTTVGLGEFGEIAAAWNQADPVALAAYFERIQSDEFPVEVARYVDDMVAAVDAATNVGLRELIEGSGPLVAARRLVEIIETLPLSRANMLMRTLQLNAFREATRLQHEANADVIEYVVRIETLDARTCLACVALHGTRYPPGTVLDDHPNGRGVFVAKVEGVPMPRQQRFANGQPVPANTGQEWWDALPDSDKFGVGRNGAAVRALQAGRISLDDMVGRKTLNLFGPIVYEKSLVSILGDEASEFYGRGT